MAENAAVVGLTAVYTIFYCRSGIRSSAAPLQNTVQDHEIKHARRNWV